MALGRSLGGRWGFVLEMLVLAALSGALAWAANAAHPAGLSWGPAPAGQGPGGTPGPGLVDVAEAMRLRAAGRVLFVDARDGQDFALAHIPGAVNVPPGLFAEDMEALLGAPGRARSMVVYCSDPECPLALRLAEGLDMLGYLDVRVFEGGMTRWTQAGGPVEGGAAKVAGS